MTTRRLSACLVVLSLGLLAHRAAFAQTSGANATHDPSRIVESNGKFYFCSTGGTCASSNDGLVWSATGLKLTIPAWSTKYAPTGTAGIWAPDILFVRNKYYIYYSFCASLPNAPCVIGLYTTPTLDSTSPDFKLTDEGVAVNNPTLDATYQFATIDPAPIVDPSANLWLSWGSGYGKDQSRTQLWLTRLDDTTGLPLASDSAYKPPTVLGYALETGRREASYVYYRNGYYYLFWNEGGCCAGTASTYTIYVARSQGNITGPYAGNRIFYASIANIHGPGHMGIYDDCGAQRFTYHYYPTETSILGENELTWSIDNWPLVGAMSTTPLKPCHQTTSGGQGGQSGQGGVAGAASGGASGSGGRSTGGAGGAGSGGAGAAGAGGSAIATGSGGGAGGEDGGTGPLGSGGTNGTGGATSSTVGSGGTRLAGSGGAGGGGTEPLGSGGADGTGGAMSSTVGSGGTRLAGSGGAGGGDGSGGAGGGDGSGGAGNGSPVSSPGKAGCGCGVSRTGGSNLGGLVLLVVLVFAIRRPRVRRKR